MKPKMTKTADIWAIVLAAGESRRMGEPKLLLSYRGRTVIEAVLENAAASRAGRTVVVLGGQADRVRAKIARFPAVQTINPDYKDGMLSSVQCGFRALPEEARAALVLLGDQPWVTAPTVDRVIQAFLGGTKGLICPVFQGKGGHPLLVDLRYREEIFRLDQAEGLRGLLRRHPEDVLRLEVGTPAVIEDLDSPRDRRKLGRL
jgi:molybdenum cofactor cytidylyltransferase